MDGGWRRLLKDALVGLLAALVVALLVAVVHADLATVLAAGIGACVVALAALEGPALIKRRKLRAAAQPHELPSALAKPSATYEGLDLELADEPRWELWRARAWITEFQVKITNNTAPARVITLMRPDLESDPGPLWAERPRLTPEEIRALFDEVHSRRPLNPHMDLRPGESRVIRVVSEAFLPYPEHEGRPYCEFVVKDAEGKTYRLPLTAPDSPGDGDLSALMRLRNLAMEGRPLREEIERQDGDGSASAEPDRSLRYEDWTNRAGRALKPWPPLRAQFQADRTAATDRDPARFAQRTDLLEEMLRALDGPGIIQRRSPAPRQPRPDGERTPRPAASDPADTPQQPCTLAQVRGLLDEGRSLRGDLDRAPPGTMPPSLLDREEGWEMSARAALEDRPNLCTHFQAAQFAVTQSAVDSLRNRLAARLEALEAIEQELTTAEG